MTAQKHIPTFDTEENAMKRIILILLSITLCLTVLTSCGKKDTALEEDVSQSKPAEDKASEDKSDDTQKEEAEKPLTPDPEPGIPAPDGWPKEIPTPVNGEIGPNGWAPDRSFYTTDIKYKQADIDAYGKRLESYGFKLQTEHDYKDDWPDATVYSDGRWDITVAEENDTFDYSYVNFFPLFDVVEDGYDGQPEGWPDAGFFQ